MTTQFTAKRTNLKLDPFYTLTLRRLQGRLCFPGNFISVVYFCFGLSADSISVHLKRIIPTFLIFKSKGSLSFTINYFNGSLKYMQWCFNQTYNIGWCHIYSFCTHVYINLWLSSNKGLIHKVIHKAQFGNIKFRQVKVFLFASLWPQRMDLHVIPQITRGGEGSGALLAWVRLLLDVGHPVVV